MIDSRFLKLLDRLRGKRMPIAHCHHAARVQALPHQLRFQSRRLPFGKHANRRSAANRRIVLRSFLRARARDEFSQRPPADARKWKVNNVGIAKEVIKEGFDRGERIWSTKLE